MNVYANYFTNIKYYDSDTNLPRLTKQFHSTTVNYNHHLVGL